MNRLLLPAALLLAMGAALDAAVLFQDNFTVGAGGYTAGSIYQQHPALTGFPTSNGWSYNTGVFSDPAGSLTMSGLTVGSARVTHRVAAYTPSGSDLWFSYQASTTTLANGTHTGAGLLNGAADNSTTVPGGGGGTGYVWGGNSGAQGNSLSGFTLGFAAGTGGSMSAFVTYQTTAATAGNTALVTQTFGSLNTNTTYQFITQLSLDTSGIDDTLNVWVVAAGSLPSTLGAPAFTISNVDIASSLNLADFTLEAGNELGTMQGTSTFDNMIASDSYSDMLSVPEPGSMALLSVGLGAALAARRAFRRPSALPAA